MAHPDSVPLIARVVAAIHRSINIDQLRIAVMQALPDLFKADGCCFYLLDEKFQIVERYPWHVPRHFLQAIERLRPHEQLVRYCVEKKCVVDCARVIGADSWHSSPLYQLGSQYGYENLVIAPVIMHQSVIGTFNMGRVGQAGPLSTGELDCLSFLSDEISVVLARLDKTIISDREKEISPQAEQIAVHLAEGASNKEIATKMDISVNTVKYHVKRLYRYYHVNNRVQLMKLL